MKIPTWLAQIDSNLAGYGAIIPALLRNDLDADNQSQRRIQRLPSLPALSGADGLAHLERGQLVIKVLSCFNR